MIYDILNEFNESNSLNYKREVCKKYKDNKLFLDVFRKTYDNVSWTYGVTMKKIPVYTNTGIIKIEQALVEIEKLSRREITGNNAIIFLHKLLSDLSEEDSKVLEKIINRDLRINFGKKEYNKIVSKEYQCLSPAYLRCDVLTKKTAKNISYPAILEKKADGMAVFASIKEDKVLCYTRSGEEFILESLQHLRFNESLINNTIQGEFTIKNESDRSQSNGLINSLIKFVNNNNKTLTQQEAKEIEDSIIFELWDILSDEEISNAKNKIKNNVTYKQRFTKLTNIFNM